MEKMMQRELLNSAMELFDSVEKWDSFVELANQRVNMEREYLKRVKEPLTSYFRNHLAEGWACEPWGDKDVDLRWYLGAFGNASLSLALGWRFEFHLRVDDLKTYDPAIMTKLLQHPDFRAVFQCFDRIDRQYEGNALAKEFRNYHFEGCPYNGSFDNDHISNLAWYAGNHTAVLVQQIIDKVERFTENKEVTGLLKRLNSEGMRTSG